MRIAPRVACVILLLAACKVAPPPLAETDKVAMRAVTDSFTTLVVARRDSAAAAFYDEHARLLPPHSGIVEGRAAIRAFIVGVPPLSAFSATSIEIDGRGDLAYLRGTYQMTFAAAAGRPAVEDHGKFVEIRRRQPDGRWLITVDIFNSDVPLPTK
jgi:ketosteroid isomerase-like protein